MIHLDMHAQPTDETCGATCLHAVYRYYGLNIPLDHVISSVDRSASGGTLSPLLGKHALLEGFSANIYVNDLTIFDPTWFKNGKADRAALCAKLEAQIECKPDLGIVQTSLAYMQYLKLGGNVQFRTISVPLLKLYFKKSIPILTGLSATYLYSSARELYTEKGISFYDDVRGTPCGHFVVLCGYDEENKHIFVVDPLRENPFSHNNYYTVSSHRLINAILLGVFTYDANLLIIQPKGI